MKDPVRLINRSGLASSLLRAGSEERPSSAQMRRALAAFGTAAAVGALTGEAAGGGATAIATGAVAGASVAKVGGASVSLLLAAKWAAIGSVGAVLFLGATELGSRVIAGPPAPSAAEVARAPSTPPFAAPGAGAFEPVNPVERIEATDSIPAAEPGDERAPEIEPNGHASRSLVEQELAMRAPNRGGGANVREASTPRRALLPTAPLVDSLPGVLEDLPTSAPSAPPSTAPASAVPSSEHGTNPTAELSASPSKNEPPALATLRLTKEVRLVDDAWTAVKRGDAARALLLLSEYERQFPELGLHPEVLFVRMEAEDRRGRAAAARGEASRIVVLYPKSAQADRARALLNRH